jgi:hypothetical protein
LLLVDGNPVPVIVIIVPPLIPPEAGVTLLMVSGIFSATTVVALILT